MCVWFPSVRVSVLPYTYTHIYNASSVRRRGYAMHKRIGRRIIIMSSFCLFGYKYKPTFGITGTFGTLPMHLQRVATGLRAAWHEWCRGVSGCRAKPLEQRWDSKITLETTISRRSLRNFGIKLIEDVRQRRKWSDFSSSFCTRKKESKNTCR